MENKNGQGIFYGVIGVATLIVAIIGATFAYFSAQAQTNAGDIQGQTLGGEESVLGLTVTRVFTATTAANSLDLVPAENIDDADDIAAAATAKCEATPGGSDTTVYTGCHLYKINVTTGNSPVNGATLTLDNLSTSNTDNTTDWKFAIFTATVTTGTYTTVGAVNSLSLINNFNAPTGASALKLIDGNLPANTNDDYYLLVYVDNKDADQSAGKDDNVTGNYTGAMTLKTASGNRVQATFGG